MFNLADVALTKLGDTCLEKKNQFSKFRFEHEETPLILGFFWFLRGSI